MLCVGIFYETRTRVHCEYPTCSTLNHSEADRWLSECFTTVTRLGEGVTEMVQ